jgi:hypothetical protein
MKVLTALGGSSKLSGQLFDIGGSIHHLPVTFNDLLTLVIALINMHSSLSPELIDFHRWPSAHHS